MPRVSTIDKCLDVLEAIVHADSQGLGVRALARQLGMNATSAHNMCHTLCDRGYLWQDPASKRFQPGLALVLLARNGQVWHRLVADAEPIVLRCQQELRESILLATINSTEIITLTYHPSSQALRVHEPHTMGPRAYGTAVGKVLLSALNGEELTRYARLFPPQRFTDNTITDLERIRTELQGVRDRGYGQTHDELTLGVSAVAVPIVGPDGQLFAALGASAPTLRMDAELMQQTRHKLAKYAASIHACWRHKHL